MNTNETNELIAEFIGLAMQHASSDGQFPMYENPLTGEYQYAEYLMYDESWDWLMPVIQKVYDEVGPKIDGMNGMNENLIGDISTALLDGNIEEAYTAVVRSIELYNEIK